MLKKVKSKTQQEKLQQHAAQIKEFLLQEIGTKVLPPIAEEAKEIAGVDFRWNADIPDDGIKLKKKGDIQTSEVKIYLYDAEITMKVEWMPQKETLRNVITLWGLQGVLGVAEGVECFPLQLRLNSIAVEGSNIKLSYLGYKLLYFEVTQGKIRKLKAIPTIASLSRDSPLVREVAHILLIHAVPILRSAVSQWASYLERAMHSFIYNLSNVSVEGSFTHPSRYLQSPPQFYYGKYTFHPAHPPTTRIHPYLMVGEEWAMTLLEAIVNGEIEITYTFDKPSPTLSGRFPAKLSLYVRIQSPTKGDALKEAEVVIRTEIEVKMPYFAYRPKVEAEATILPPTPVKEIGKITKIMSELPAYFVQEDIPAVTSLISNLHKRLGEGVKTWLEVENERMKTP